VLLKGDHESCVSYNTNVMREIINKKMRKNKTFFELKVNMTDRQSITTRLRMSGGNAILGGGGIMAQHNIVTS
jgi:hypothetical protein